MYYSQRVFRTKRAENTGAIHARRSGAVNAASIPLRTELLIFFDIVSDTHIRRPGPAGRPTRGADFFQPPSVFFTERISSLVSVLPPDTGCKVKPRNPSRLRIVRTSMLRFQIAVGTPTGGVRSESSATPAMSIHVLHDESRTRKLHRMIFHRLGLNENIVIVFLTITTPYTDDNRRYQWGCRVCGSTP